MSTAQPLGKADWYGKEDIPKLDEQGSKVCIVTGGNSGVGLVSVRELYRAGWKVVFTVRSEEAGQATIDAIKADVGDDAGELQAEILELTDTSSVESFSSRMLEQLTELHVLLNNAATGPINDFKLTGDGEEYIFAANHTGHYLLTMRLMPLLVAAPAARIVNVASGNLTKACKDPLATFDDAKRNSKASYGFNGAGAYKRSKISNVWFTTALAERLAKAGITNVTAHCVNPGKHGDSKILSTAFDNMSPTDRFSVGIYLWAKYKRSPPSVELAALNMIFICTDDRFDSAERAHYVSSKKDAVKNKVMAFEDTIPKMLDKPEYPEKLWELSVRLTGADYFTAS